MLGQNLVRDHTDSAIVELGKRLVEPRGIGQPDDHFVVPLIGVLRGLGSTMSIKRWWDSAGVCDSDAMSSLGADCALSGSLGNSLLWIVFPEFDVTWNCLVSAVRLSP
jgi:hypothetical protein